MSYVNNRGVVSLNNNTTTPLNAAATFTGTAEEAVAFSSVTVACLTDQVGTLYVDFSPDGTNWDSTLSFVVAPNVNEVHRITVTRKFMRVRMTNTSVSNQTFLRLQTLLGSYQSLTSSLNSVMQQDADSLIVRPMDFNLLVGEGKFQGANITIKDGFNQDVDTGSVPEDIWDNGGLYTGFVTAAAAAEVVSSSASDTGTLWYSYMATSDDLDYVFASVTLNGTTPVSLGHDIWRCNFAYYDSGGVGFNVGLLSIRLTAAPTSIFVTVPIGYSQSYCAAYTVPKNSNVYIDRITGTLRGSTSGSCEGVFYFKPLNESPRYRFPFELNFGALYFDDMDYNVRIPQQVDIIPRILSASANNLSPKVSYRLLKIKQ